MSYNKLKEVDFLVRFAVRKFNEQFNKKFDYTHFAVKQIDKGTRHHQAYELFTVRQDDYLRLRIYIRFDRFDELKNYRIELEENLYNPTGNEDEVHVAEGTIAKSWIDNGIYRFRDMTEVNVPGDFILDENMFQLMTEDGELISLEDFSR